MPRTRPGLRSNQHNADLERDRGSDDRDDARDDHDEGYDEPQEDAGAPAPGQPSKFVNALDYLDLLKQRLPTAQYSAFLDIMKDFKRQVCAPL